MAGTPDNKNIPERVGYSEMYSNFPKGRRSSGFTIRPETSTAPVTNEQKSQKSNRVNLNQK